ncbi:GNAT family N-acetyltransferase [Aeromicrobium tamlense]|uniref:GNAT family N-acetyltransferase n=1 Tax=Aeromicrobium tamlense TaxID=375541 RepID=A0A8I0FVW0_9ACTN|nr:GNAT family N-acetyltransferase [Aeromicrobium tamlense]MBD1269911.1 GNAT family N-acetyltransferase [Aeromicrobium tamlense]NYI39432.1 ribosomal protein S18 acetylase RimI-like enzyme [Aeromicrobium tamlense]
MSTRLATGADLPTLASVLGEAFADYPWTRWTLPGDGRLARLTEIQGVYLAHAAAHGGRVWTTPELDAVAVLIPTSLPDPSPEVGERIVALHGDGWQRLVEHEVAIGPRRPEADWLLATVGVDPAQQGRGLGTTVLEAALADLGDARVLLETSSEANVRLYERLGFRVVEQVESAGPDVWIMLR